MAANLPARPCLWIAFTITDQVNGKYPQCSPDDLWCSQSYCEPTHTHTQTQTHRCEQSAVSKLEQTNSKSKCSVQHKQLYLNFKLCATQHVWSVYRTTALTLCTALPPLHTLFRTTALRALCTALPPLRSLYRTTALTLSAPDYPLTLSRSFLSPIKINHSNFAFPLSASHGSAVANVGIILNFLK